MLPALIDRLEKAAAGHRIQLSAAELNELARLIAACRLLPYTPARAGRHTPADHHWEVLAERFTPAATSDAASADLWRVSVGAGCVLDELAAIPYLRQGDPRGWAMPEGYVGPMPGDLDYSAEFIDRDLLDDLADPPFLLARAPSPTLQVSPSSASDFTVAARNEQTGAILYQSHVLLTVEPSPQLSPVEVTAAPFRRPRLSIARALPSFATPAAAGGWMELATLYLRRTTDDPADDTLTVFQREFWSFWNFLIQPGLYIPAEIAAAGGDAAILGGVENLLLEADSVAWWTV